LHGSQADFDYDATGELTFKDRAAFESFFGLLNQPDMVAKIAADCDQFMDQDKTRVVVLSDCVETTRVSS
jgi:EthD domain